jgi:hypothetical protein
MSDYSAERLQATASDLLQEVLRRTHLSTAHDLGVVLAEEARRIGADPVVLYVLDHEQKWLVPVPGPPAVAGRERLLVRGTVAGRVFASSSIVDVAGDGGGRRLWLPLIDGTERLGVVELSFADPQGPVRSRSSRCVSASSIWPRR